MSYEGKMLRNLNMPSREDVEQALLSTLFNHGGVVKEFGVGEEIVQEIADEFGLSENQRVAYLETIYRKENRVKRSNLWHRLLFRAADSLAKQKLISKPTQTVRLTEKREWMLTEEGYDKALSLRGLSMSNKDILFIKSFEVEKIAKQLKEENKPDNYNPIGLKEKSQITKNIALRARGFRQVIIESYDFKCAVCGLKLYSPKTYQWEVEAAHIIPHSYDGKDDIWNGLSLCRFHHWAFDVGWYSFNQNLQIIASKYLDKLPDNMGKVWEFNIIKQLCNEKLTIQLPKEEKLWPDIKAIQWHRENIFQAN